MVDIVKLEADEVGIEHFCRVYRMDLHKKHKDCQSYAYLLDLVQAWKRGNYHVYMVFSEDDLMGLCHGEKLSSYAFQGHVHFFPWCRGRKALKAFDMVCEQVVDDLGLTELLTLTPVSYRNAIRFVQAVGFEEVERIKDHHVFGDGRKEDVKVLVKRYDARYK